MSRKEEITMKIKRIAKLLGFCCLTAGLALPANTQAATGDNGHVTATSVLAEKAGQQPAVTETQAAQPQRNKKDGVEAFLQPFQGGRVKMVVMVV